MDTYTDKENAKAKLNTALEEYFDAAYKDGSELSQIYSELEDLIFDMGYNVRIHDAEALPI